MRLLFYFLVLAVMSVYITLRAHHVFTLRRLEKMPGWLAWLLSLIPAAAGLSVIPITANLAAGIIALAHLTALLVFFDVLFCFIPERKAGKEQWKAAAFVLSFLACGAYIAYGAVNAFTVTPTRYELCTDKSTGGEKIRVVQISDCHLGTTFDGEGFARHIRAINDCRPDVLVITGDFVDSRTSMEEMTAACAALADVQADYGVYYVPGNHENRLDARKLDELYRLLGQAGVTILEDEWTVMDDRFCICGRKDAYDRSRAPVDKVLPPDDSLYTIVLDHQPREYDVYAANGADLVLSGHTHAGQMFPLGWFIQAIGMGEKTYGMEQRDGTTFIVSSGLSGLIPLRTEAKSEFVIIDIISTAE